MLDVTLTSTSAYDTSGLYVTAGKDSTGRKALLMANLSAAAVRVVINGVPAPLRLYGVSDTSGSLQESSQNSTTVTVPAYGVMLVTSET